MGVKIGSSATVGGNFGSKATFYNCGFETGEFVLGIHISGKCVPEFSSFYSEGVVIVCLNKGCSFGC